MNTKILFSKNVLMKNKVLHRNFLMNSLVDIGKFSETCIIFSKQIKKSIVK